MSKIGDLFVRLGLKKSEFDRGMDEAKAKTKGFGESMKEIGSKAKVAFAAIAVAAAAFVNEFVRHSQRFGDQWDTTLNRMKAAWSTFLTALTNWDWESFGRRISGAMNAAAQSTAAHDLEVEVQNSINIRKGQMQEELAMLQIQMRNTQLSYKERAEAARQYLEKVRPIYDQEIALREKIRQADLNEYLGKAGLGQTAGNRQALEAFLADVAPNEALLSALDNYTRRNRGAKKYKFTAEDEKLVDAFLSRYDTSTGAAIAALAETYVGSSDAEAKKVTDAITGLYSAQAAYNEETRRIQQTLNAAEAGELKAPAVGASSSGTDAALEAQRKQAERIAQQAAEYQLSERTQLKKHYEEEKALLEAFGIDTTMLTLKYLDMDSELTRKELEEDKEMLQDQMADFEESFKVELEPFELGPGVQEFLDELTRLQEEAEDRAQRFKEALVGGFADGIQELTDQLMGLSEVNGGAILKALLTPLADMAQQEGELLILQGIGIEAIKSALTSLNGIAAVAAGTALVAAAAAVKSGLSRIAQGGSAAGVASTGASDVGTGLVGSVQDLELTVKIEGQLRGSDIVLAAERTQANWSR